ncbi:MAG: hypothetical protein M1812_005416 [Candelaria pacifica]|nr:MAG: hypothetical protein M1812_005416 [Candelaria pacifica]
MASNWTQDESGASLLGNTPNGGNQPISRVSEEALGSESLSDDRINSHSRQRRRGWRDYVPFLNDGIQGSRDGRDAGFTHEKTVTSRRRRFFRTCFKIILGVLAAMWVNTNIQRQQVHQLIPSSGILSTLSFLVSPTQLLRTKEDLSQILSTWNQPNHAGSFLSHWPTDFSRDILPIPCHSHNDYWRRVPLYDAISSGCISVEADIWLFDNELYVGHDTSSLTRNRTLRGLYLDPIMNILEKQNPSKEFTVPNDDDDDIVNGIFDTDPSQPLILLIDFKTDGPKTWPFLIEQLNPLLQRGYLTTFNGTDIIPGPIIIVGTGNTPFNLLTANNNTRHIFFDAPLDQMWEAENSNNNDSSSDESTPSSIHSTNQKRHRDGPSEFLPDPPSPTPSNPTPPTPIPTNETYTSQNSYYASVSFKKAIGSLWWRKQLSVSQMNLIRGQIRGAHRRGLKVRYWDLPSWPIGLRNFVWGVLVREGVDLLNVDDLKVVKGGGWF